MEFPAILPTQAGEIVYPPKEPSLPRLALRHLAPTDNTPRQTGGIVLYIHGATFPSGLAVGYRFDGWSWMDDLAAARCDVWALDFPGYGESERYAAMDTGEANAAPLCRTPEASEHIARAVAFIRARCGDARVSLIAHSWGTLAAGHFAAAHPQSVDRLALFAPIIRRDSVLPGGVAPAFRDIPLAAQWARFVEDVPAHEPPVLLQRHFDKWGADYLATDPTSGRRMPPSVRTPGGPMADIAAAWGGKVPYDPAQIVAPTLIVRGAWDSLCTDADSHWLFDALRSAPRKQDVKLSRATHLMHLEEGRFALYRVVQSFLEGGDTPMTGNPHTNTRR